MSALLLAIETSGRSLGIALWGAQGLHSEIRVQDGARHGVALAPSIKDLLQQSNIKVHQLSGVGVSLGPGSWTGLRIGLAVAKALSWGATVPLVGVPSMEALALAAARRGKQGSEGVLVVTIRNAYTEGLYAAIWRETLEGLERLIPEQVMRSERVSGVVDECLKGLHLQELPPVILCGDSICLKALAEAARIQGWSVQSDLDEIPVAALAECAWMRLQRGSAEACVWRTPAEIHAAAPMYLRASDPELKLKRKEA